MVYKLGGYKEGLWVEGQVKGLGVEKDIHGNVFKGQFKNDQKHGRGKINLAEQPGQLVQGTYDGGWSENKRNGQGVEHCQLSPGQGCQGKIADV